MSKKRNNAFIIEFPKIVIADDMEDFEKQVATITAECKASHPDAQVYAFNLVVGGIITSYGTNKTAVKTP
jgi:hypothetical protein